ncbi:3-keto-5-aminohexanoate cleavage protein [Papillibacter cinnamivorans]|uniref:3-keto-5-aminohexanoate cleavage enzyme n=1 Tax=Papillibacter cinnamivorans DSM 12816 TaxID=1122930 RepID=A0A1W1YKU8_9FIRM|nr:3-keto-5-aminohexanoate cleavage protein [Papillibacter cinnamivorans]SMC36358.1 3-keto-5-aminohexanoate cleavage enzyme [Papillibacter cinnamivorans DSM 12816]
MSDKINWEYIKEFNDSIRTIWMPFGLPEIIDPSHSRFSNGVDIQPAWKIPPKIAISTTITGAMFSSRGNPNHPMTLEEISKSAREACEAGSPIVHIHVRDENGYNVLDPEKFHKVIDPLKRDFPDTVFDGCMCALDSAEWPHMESFLKEGLLEVTPINTVAVLYGDTLFAKPPYSMIEKTKICQDCGVKPQIAIYTDADVDNADRFLIKPGLLQKPYHWIILAAVPGCSPMQNPRQMVEGLMRTYNNIMDIDDTASVMVCAAGRASSYLATFAMLMGLHIRVGMEDTVWKWPHKDDKIVNNAEHFKLFKTMAGMLGREVMTPDEYRRMIGLPVRKK